MLGLMYVALGGAIGSMCRYLMMMGVTRYHMTEFPFGTFAVNILGGFLMGAWIAIMANMMPSRAKDLHLLFAVGVLGGFTTFSAFTLDMYLLFERGLLLQAFLYIIGSVALSLAALLAGMWTVRLAAS